VDPTLRAGAASSSMSGAHAEMVGVVELAAREVGISVAWVVQRGDLTSVPERRVADFRRVGFAATADRSTATMAPRWFQHQIVRRREGSAQTEVPVVD
jgi:hypothetical protein